MPYPVRCVGSSAFPLSILIAKWPGSPPHSVILPAAFVAHLSGTSCDSVTSCWLLCFCPWILFTASHLQPQFLPQATRKEIQTSSHPHPCSLRIVSVKVLISLFLGVILETFMWLKIAGLWEIACLIWSSGLDKEPSVFLNEKIDPILMFLLRKLAGPLFCWVRPVARLELRLESRSCFSWKNHPKLPVTGALWRKSLGNSGLWLTGSEVFISYHNTEQGEVLK